MVASALHAGEGIGVPPDCIKFFGNLKSGPFLSPLENHMFNKMGGAAFGRCFIARADINPYSQGYAPGIGHFFGKDPDAILEDRFLEGFAHLWASLVDFPRWLYDSIGFFRPDRLQEP